jgi:hypothetical protein
MLVDVLPLHDALFTSISSKGHELSLSFEDGGKQYDLQIEGLVGLYMDSFLAGNIVLSASVYSLPLTDDDAVSIQGIIEKYSEYYKSPALQSAAGKAFVIESSYGAELIAVFTGRIVTPCGFGEGRGHETYPRRPSP